MFGRRVSVLVALVVALGIGLWGTVGFASPKDNDDAHHNNDKGRSSTLTVLTKTREARVVDLDPQGASQGDMRILNAPLYNESGKEKVGRLDLFTVLTDPADGSSEKANMVESTYTYTLPGGEISAQGVAALPTLTKPAPSQVDAISGGTGKYVGVRGEVRIKTHGNKVTSTFYFID